MQTTLAGKNVDRWRRPVLATLVSYGTIFLLCTLGTLVPAEAQERSTQSPAPLPERQLRIDWGITNVQYRQEILALTPIGSSYADVKAFILNEWHAERLPIITPPNWPAGMTLLGGSEIVLQPGFEGFGWSNFLRGEPPHIKMRDVRNPFPAHQGRRYIQPFFFYRPVWWKRGLYVTAVYVFDARSKVIDLFAVGGVDMPSP
jgi:hypothetical protein